MTSSDAFFFFFDYWLSPSCFNMSENVKHEIKMHLTYVKATEYQEEMSEC